MTLWLLTCCLALSWWWCTECGSPPPPTDDCSYCTGGGADNAPFYLTVTFAGWANSSCTSCGSYDGTYIVSGPLWTGLGYCQWSWSRSTGTNCSTASEQITVQFGYGYPLYGIRVTFTQTKNGQTNIYRWFRSQMSELDCMGLSGLSIAYQSRSIGITETGVSCATSGSTCTLTAGDGS